MSDTSGDGDFVDPFGEFDPISNGEFVDPFGEFDPIQTPEQTQANELINRVDELSPVVTQILETGPTQSPSFLQRINPANVGQLPQNTFSDAERDSVTEYVETLEELATLSEDEEFIDEVAGIRRALTEQNDAAAVAAIGRFDGSGLVAAADLIGSSVRSGINQGRLALGGEGDPSTEGFLRNLSIGEDPIRFDEAVGLGGRTPGLPGFDVPFIGGAVSVATREILNFVGEVATDPTTYIGAAGLRGVRINGADFASVGSRVGRTNLRGEVANRINALRPTIATDDLAVFNSNSNEVLRAVDRGGISAARAAVRREGGNLTDEFLDELGLGQGVRLAGREVPGTAPVTRVAGRVNLGPKLDALEGSALRAREAALREGGVVDEVTNIAIRENTQLAVSYASSARARAEGLRNQSASGGRIAARLGRTDDLIPRLNEAQQRELFGGGYNKPLAEFRDYIDQRILAGTPLRDVLDEFDPNLQRATDAQRSDANIRDADLSDEALAIAPDVVTVFRRADELVEELEARGGDAIFSQERLGSEIMQFIGNKNGDVRGRNDFFWRLGLLEANIDTLTTASDGLRTSLYKMADEIDGLSNEAINSFRDAVGMSPWTAIDNLQRSGDEIENLARAATMDGLPPAWAETVHDMNRGAFNALKIGDRTLMEQNLRRLSAVARRQIDAIDNTKRIIIDTDLQGFENASRDFKSKVNRLKDQLANDNDGFYRDFEQVIAENFLRPDLVANTRVKTGNPVAVDAEHLPYFALADPDVSIALLDDWRARLYDWEVGSREAIEGYRRNHTPEMAETLEILDSWHHATVMQNGLAEAMTIARNGRPLLDDLPDITKDYVDDLMDSAIAVHHSTTGKINPVIWAEHMADTLGFLNNLRPPDNLTILNRLNKGWKPLALASRFLSFAATNLNGGRFNNFFKFDQMTVARVNQANKYGGIGRRAIAEERASGARTNSSLIWDEITDVRHREIMQTIFRMDIPLASAFGNPTARADEFIEAGAGDERSRFQIAGGRVGRAGFAVSDFAGRAVSRNEALMLGTRGVFVPNVSAAEAFRGVRSNADQGGLFDYARPSVEGRVRTELAFAIMDEGGSIEDAVRAIGTTHFDYWDVGQFAQAAEELMPFYLFRSRMLNQTGQFYASNPGLLSAQLRAQAASSNADPFGNQNTENQTTFGALRLGLSIFGADVNTIRLDPDLPIDSGLEDVRRILNRDALGLATNNLSPFIATPIQARTSNNLGLEFIDDQHAPASEWGPSGEIIRRVPGMVNVVNLISGGQAARKVNGEVWLTRQGDAILTDLIPGLGTFISITERDGNNLDEYLGEGADFEGERFGRIMDAFFMVLGYPLDHVSEGNRLDAIRNRRFDAQDRIDELELYAEVQEARSQGNQESLEEFLDSLGAG